MIGGGVTGCSCALTLAERGIRVRLHEAREIAGGASGRNGGFALRGAAAPYDEARRELGEDRAPPPPPFLPPPTSPPHFFIYITTFPSHSPIPSTPLSLPLLSPSLPSSPRPPTPPRLSSPPAAPAPPPRPLPPPGRPRPLTARPAARARARARAAGRAGPAAPAPRGRGAGPASLRGPAAGPGAGRAPARPRRAGALRGGPRPRARSPARRRVWRPRVATSRRTEAARASRRARVTLVRGPSRALGGAGADAAPRAPSRRRRGSVGVACPIVSSPLSRELRGAWRSPPFGRPAWCGSFLSICLERGEAVLGS